MAFPSLAHRSPARKLVDSKVNSAQAIAPARSRQNKTVLFRVRRPFACAEEFC
jgi:hypothetical protein